MKKTILIYTDDGELWWYEADGDDRGAPALIRPRGDKREGEKQKPDDSPGRVH